MLTVIVLLPESGKQKHPQAVGIAVFRDARHGGTFGHALRQGLCGEGRGENQNRRKNREASKMHVFSLAEREETTRSAKSSAPFMLLVVSSFLDTVRTSVLHLEAMQDLSVRAGERIRFALPLVKLAEH